MNGIASMNALPYVFTCNIKQMKNSDMPDISAIGCSESDEVRAIDWFHKMEEMIAMIAKNSSR